MNESPPLLKQILRTTAIMLIPIAAFLAILSAVALFAVPSANPSAKEDRVVTPDEVKEKSTDRPPTQASPMGTRITGARGRPNKI